MFYITVKDLKYKTAVCNIIDNDRQKFVIKYDDNSYALFGFHFDGEFSSGVFTPHDEHQIINFFAYKSGGVVKYANPDTSKFIYSDSVARFEQKPVLVLTQEELNLYKQPIRERIAKINSYKENNKNGR